MPRTSSMIRWVQFVLALSLGIPAASASAQAPVPSSAAIERRVDSLLARLSLADKLTLVGGTDHLFTRPASAIGLPRMKMTDGPLGVGSWGPSTAYAAGITLAATWDPALARRVGAAIGADARARGVDILLGPGVNLAREPMNGRNFEYFGEDPWLAARTAVGYITGVQSQGVVATVKHFAANNVETDRHDVDVRIDERTLRELYLPAFEAAVRDAHVGAVMSSYNRLNGPHTTQQPALNLNILKTEWAFDGLLMSDWGATYDGVAAANGGLDLEMPRAKFMAPDTLHAAVDRGAVSVATIDDKVRRLLRTAIRFGILDRPPVVVPATPRETDTARAASLDVAREGIVLLKNAGPLLPLAPARLRTIAVIGPDADPVIPGGGGSAEITPLHSTSFLKGISDAVGPNVRVLYARGLPAPIDIMRQTVFDPIDGGPGVTVERFSTSDWSGAPTSVSHERVIEEGVRDRQGPPTPATSARWRARYTPATSGSYLLIANAGDEDSYTISIDGRPVLAHPHREGQGPVSVTVPLVAKRTVALQVDYMQRSAHTRLGVGIIAVDSLVSAEAKRIAARADVAVVCVGYDHDTESEGFDRTFGLPSGQDLLVRAVATANRHTIVTLTSGGGVDVGPWIDRVPVLLQTWYAGEDGGTALADILMGRRAPEGKLPVTFDRTWAENPVHTHDMPIWDSAAAMPRLVYAESLLVGYRYYTTARRAPRFPFGFGLSYTTFAISNLHAPRRGVAHEGVDVTFDVTNTGTVAGAEVAQLYVGDPSARVRRPVKELKGFAKVRLAPGERQHVTMHLDERAFAYFDVTTHGWRVDPGTFVLYVGNASDHTPLRWNIDMYP